MKPLLTALDIDVGYTQCQQQQRLLTQFNFTLAPHEIVTLLGPSGVGKSSLLKVLAGLSPPLAGTVYYQGVPLTGPHPQHSVALHAPCLLPWLSLEKNVAFGLDFKCQQPLSRSQQQARIDCAIHAVGLERHRRKMPAQLSLHNTKKYNRENKHHHNVYHRRQSGFKEVSNFCKTKSGN